MQEDYLFMYCALEAYITNNGTTIPSPVDIDQWRTGYEPDFCLLNRFFYPLCPIVKPSISLPPVTVNQCSCLAAFVCYSYNHFKTVWNIKYFVICSDSNVLRKISSVWLWIFNVDFSPRVVCACSRTNRKPYTGQITKNVLYVHICLWSTIISTRIHTSLLFAYLTLLNWNFFF